MTILLIGGTGNFGRLIADELFQRGADTRVLTRRQPRSDDVAHGPVPVVGELTDVDFMRNELQDVSTVLLLVPAVPDELTRTLLAISLIADAGIQRLVYISMMGADTFVDAPRAAAKHAAERAIAARHIPATILRPNAAFQNDLGLLDALLAEHSYTTPLGSVGVSMIDSRDVAEAAASMLVERESSGVALPAQTLDLVGPEVFTGETMARLWSELLGKPVTYDGDDLDAIERAFGAVMSDAGAYDLNLVFRSIVRDGVVGSPGTADRLAELLGHPLRTYRSFAEEALASRS